MEPNTGPGPLLVAGVRLCCPANWGRGWAESGKRRPSQELQLLALVGWEGGPKGPQMPMFCTFGSPDLCKFLPGGHRLLLRFHNTAGKLGEGSPASKAPGLL